MQNLVKGSFIGGNGQYYKFSFLFCSKSVLGGGAKGTCVGGPNLIFLLQNHQCTNKLRAIVYKKIIFYGKTES